MDFISLYSIKDKIKKLIMTYKKIEKIVFFLISSQLFTAPLLEG